MISKIIKIKMYFVFLMIGFTIFSCTKNFNDINSNPNQPEKVEPDFLLTTSVFETMNVFGGEMNRVVFFNYTQHFSGFQGEFQRYMVGESPNNTYWRNMWLLAFQPVNQIIKLYNGNETYKNRVIIARIWKSYLLSNAVAIWGSVPNGENLDGDMSVPYEKEEEIYKRLLNDLKIYADAIDLNGDRYMAAADRVYGGNLLKWKKFANTLRLKIALRISNAAPNGDPVLSRQVIQEVMNDETNTIVSQDETAASTWGTMQNTWNPLYDRAVYNYSANIATIPVFCESLAYHTIPYNDPRLPVYAKPATKGPRIGTYFGQNISYGGGGQYARGNENPHTGLRQDDYSQIGDRFTKADAEYIFLSLAEAGFLKSEAAYKGFWGTAADAEKYYYRGIDASLERYGLSTAAATAYKNTPGIKWGSVSDTLGRDSLFKDWLEIASSIIRPGDQYKQIIMQHWLAIPFQGVDAWTLLRRTQILEFQPQFATYDGVYKYMPHRISYPTDEYQTNPVAVKEAVGWLSGTDDLFTKLWFAIPTRKNPYLPF